MSSALGRAVLSAVLCFAHSIAQGGGIYQPLFEFVVPLRDMDMLLWDLLLSSSSSRLLIMASRTMLSTSISGGRDERSSARRLGSFLTLHTAEASKASQYAAGAAT